jgi:hypothetical protein
MTSTRAIYLDLKKKPFSLNIHWKKNQRWMKAGQNKLLFKVFPAKIFKKIDKFLFFPDFFNNIYLGFGTKETSKTQFKMAAIENC